MAVNMLCIVCVGTSLALPAAAEVPNDSPVPAQPPAQAQPIPERIDPRPLEGPVAAPVDRVRTGPQPVARGYAVSGPIWRIGG